MSLVARIRAHALGHLLRRTALVDQEIMRR
jgi:hypothetical protein